LKLFGYAELKLSFKEKLIDIKQDGSIVILNLKKLNTLSSNVLQLSPSLKIKITNIFSFTGLLLSH